MTCRRHGGCALAHSGALRNPCHKCAVGCVVGGGRGEDGCGSRHRKAAAGTMGVGVSFVVGISGSCRGTLLYLLPTLLLCLSSAVLCVLLQ